MAFSMSMSVLLLFIFFPILSTPRKPHVISFRSLNLYPKGIAHDPIAQHFIVGSLRHRSIHSVSDAGVIETLISDPFLPLNTTILGLAVDSITNRLLAVVHAIDPLPPFNALAAYDLVSRRRLFLADLPEKTNSSSFPTSAAARAEANAVAIDSNGNAHVTNSEANFIWKVTRDGKLSISSTSSSFDPGKSDQCYGNCGLNGIGYVSKGYLLVVQSNTGKMFKVDAEDGRVRTVLLNQNLNGADGLAVRSDGVVLVVSPEKLWFLKSDDSWGEGVVYDEINLDMSRSPSSVVVGREDRVYVLYSSVMEGMMENSGQEWYQIEEVRSEMESRDENVWVFVFVGIGLAYFLYWRFQMKQLVKSMGVEKKIN